MKFLATMKLLYNQKISNIKIVRGITGLGLAEAKELVEKMDFDNAGAEVEVTLSGDQIAQFYADKNRGVVPDAFLLRNIRELPQNRAFDLTGVTR